MGEHGEKNDQNNILSRNRPDRCRLDRDVNIGVSAIEDPLSQMAGELAGENEVDQQSTQGDGREQYNHAAHELAPRHPEPPHEIDLPLYEVDERGEELVGNIRTDQEDDGGQSVDRLIAFEGVGGV